MPEEKTSLKVASVAFSEGANIPVDYSCEGRNINPPLEILGIPEGTRSLVLVMEDHDAPRGIFDHWLVWNIAPGDPIAEGSVPGIEGRNGFGKTGYGGPCPPSGMHRYFFFGYALDAFLDLMAGADKKALFTAMEGHILASGQLMAYYKRIRSSL
jgi:Raf kinase inhibitor-like YbhB/YbcL family protein